MAPAADAPNGAAEPVTWSSAQVAEWLNSLHLPSEVAREFLKNAVTGADLATLSDEDLTDHLHLAPLQARKVRKSLTLLGVAPPPSAAPEAAAAALTMPVVPEDVPPSPAAAAAAAAAAQPAVAAGAVAAAEADPRANFEAGDLQRHAQLKQSIADLQAMQIPSQLVTARNFAASTQQQVTAAQGNLAATRAALQKEERQVAKYEAGGGGCLCFGKEGAKVKQGQSEAAVQKLQQQVKAQEAQAVALATQQQEALAQLTAWQGKEAELSTAQRTLEQLVERMFAAPAWRASPRQNELADTTRALETQAAEAAQGVSVYGRGAQLLRSAAAQLQEALQALGRTQMIGAVNMGRGIAFQARTGAGARRQPGRQMGNLVEMAVFRRANEGVMQAARAVSEASGLLPGMPKVDQSVLSSARAGMFQNILLGGVVSSAIQMAAVRRSIEGVKQLLDQVQACLMWAQSNLAVYQHKEAQLRAQAASTKAELEAFRRQALQAAATAAA